MTQEPRPKNRDPKLILALDVDTLERAKHFVDLLYPAVKIFKVGSQLFTACGPEAVKMVAEKGGKVFLDLKFYDIPNTVYSAVASGTASNLTIYSIPSGLNEVKAQEQVKESVNPAVFMMTVHTKGGMAMLKAAVSGAEEKSRELKIARPFIVGVTRLTSDENNSNIQQEVLAAARLAKDSGLDGVVCSVLEAQLIRKEFGDKFIIVTPGIRPKGSSAGDQKRAATASEAIAAGSDYIVVGRPILEAADPLKVVRELI